MCDAQLYQLVFTAEIFSVYVNNNKLSFSCINTILYISKQRLSIFMNIIEDFFQLAI